MGEYLGFRCNFCGYEESSIPVGRGRDTSVELKLFICGSCKSVNSTWVKAGDMPRCSICYDRDIKVLEPVVQQIQCPKCNTEAAIVPVEGSWE